MKKFLLGLLIASVLLFTSCDAFLDTSSFEKPKMYFIGIGLDYEHWNRNPAHEDLHGRSMLQNTENDLRAVTEQFRNLAINAGYDYRFVTYDDFESEVYPSLPYGRDFQYRFMFNSFSGNGGEEVEDEPEQYTFRSIAGIDSDGNRNPVQLVDFARDFSEHLNNRITNNGKEIPSKNDIMVFYYTGHGIQNGLGPAVYYQTGLDGNLKDEERTMGCDSTQSITTSNLNFIMPLPYLYIDEFIFDQYEATVVTLFDCCYSGYAIDNDDLGSIKDFSVHAFENGVRDDKLEIPGINKIFTNTYLATFGDNSASNHVFHLTAAHATQTSFDKDLNPTKPNQVKHGAFTYQVLSYLDYDLVNEQAGNPTRKCYTLNDMYNHVYRNISYETRTYATPNVTRSRYDLALFIM